MELLLGNCLDRLKDLEDNSVDAIVCDPPYGLSFMGKKWDYDVPQVEVWKECLRVLKPGGYLLSFAGTRTQHRMAVNIEDAGFEIRDMIMYVYGSGFPKSLNIGKAVDKLQGNEREVVGYAKSNPDLRDVGRISKENCGIDKLSFGQGQGAKRQQTQIDKGTSEWEGWGTALKPALEPITVARKPLEKGLTIAQNCLKWGVGGINIDGSRVEGKPRTTHKDGNHTGNSSDSAIFPMPNIKTTEPLGRFPANLIHDGSEEVVGLFPRAKGGAYPKERGKSGIGFGSGNFSGDSPAHQMGDDGSAARFFMSCKYTPKDAIMNICEDSIYVNNVGNSLPIMSLIESVVNISSVLKSATPNLDLLNHYLNVLFVEKKSESIVIDFVAKLVAISEVPEGVLNQQELTVIQDFITSCKGCSQTQNPVSSVGKWEDTDITQIIINLLRLCGYVLLATEENTNSGKREVGVVNGEPKRFLYCSKASKRERNIGCEGLEEKNNRKLMGNANNTAEKASKGFERFDTLPAKNNHPTVKPIALMEYLVKLVSKEGHIVLDPFMGSGTTGMACKKLNREFIGIEMMPEYMEIAKCRIEGVKKREQLNML